MLAVVMTVVAVTAFVAILRWHSQSQSPGQSRENNCCKNFVHELSKNCEASRDAVARSAKQPDRRFAGVWMPYLLCTTMPASRPREGSGVLIQYAPLGKGRWSARFVE
jgi:hypothetical protein